MEFKYTEEFYKNLINEQNINLVDQRLNKFSKEELFNLAKSLLKKPFEFKTTLTYVLCILFEDSQEFAELLNTFLEMTFSEKPLSKDIVNQKIIMFSLVKKIVHIGKNPGRSAGIILSWIVQEMEDAKEFMILGLNSDDICLQKCSLIALNSTMYEDKIEYDFGILKKVSQNIGQENTSLLMVSLQYAYEKDNSYEEILEYEIIRRDIIGAKDYVIISHNRKNVSIKSLKKAIDILEQDDVNNEIVEMGLTKIYVHDQNFVVEKIRKKLQNILFLSSRHSYLIEKINEIGPDPIFEMLETEIDKGKIDEYVLEIFFPNCDIDTHWVTWCEKWKNDNRKELIILKSLGIILSKLINNPAKSIIRDRSITLIKSFASNKNINYQAQTNGITFDENKEKDDTLRALYIVDKILRPHIQFDIKILNENLKNMPYSSKYINMKSFIKKDQHGNNHPLLHIFAAKSPERLISEMEKEKDENKKSDLAFEYKISLECKKIQSYWENVFKILSQYNININKKDFSDVNNIWSALVEAEIFSRFAPYITEIEPEIKEFGDKRLDLLIEYDNEFAILEICTIHDKYEESLSKDVIISTPGKKIKNVLLNKFKIQLKEGKYDPKIPVLIIACLEEGLRISDINDAIYGRLQISTFKNNNQIIGQGMVHGDDGFYDLNGTELITAIGAYKRDYEKKDSLIGKLYYPYKSPKNKMSQKFRLKLRDTLFGTSEISDWKSLMDIPDIDEEISRLLYKNGIEDLRVLSNITENEFVIEKIPWERLQQLKTEAIRIMKAKSTDSIIYLKGIDRETINILQRNDIYLISEFLKRKAIPEGIPFNIWSSLKEDAEIIYRKI